VFPNGYSSPLNLQLVTHNSQLFDFIGRLPYFVPVDDIVTRVDQAIIKHGLLSHGDPVLIAFSGGPDSLALLHIVNKLKDKYDIKLAAAHLDHGIRPASAKDREFCHEICQKLHIKFYSKRLNIPALAKKQGLSIEEAGREARYGWFESLSENYGYHKIATGHTLDDSVETILFNMARGCGLSGLSGIPLMRGKIIRPLLDLEKMELLEWLKAHNIKYLQDITNRSVAYSRNRIRLNILPELEKINPATKRNIARLSRIVGDELEFFERITVSVYKDVLHEAGKSKIVLDLAKLVQYDKSLIKKVLNEAIKKLSGDAVALSSQNLARALSIIDGDSGRKAPLARGFYIEKSQGRIAILNAPTRSLTISLDIPGKIELPDGLLEARIIGKDNMWGLDRANLNVYLDYGKMKNIAVRYWQDGDKIRPFGMNGHRLLSDIFIDCKIPEFEREAVPLLISENKIAWIVGIMISDDFKVTDQTQEVLNLRYASIDY
jgi:tRNA(Ile)-lysidine synthase